MEIYRVGGILEQVAGEYQDHRFVRLHEALLQQLLQPRKRNRRGGFAANTFGANLGLGLSDFHFADLLARAPRRFEDMNCFLPRSDGGLDRKSTPLNSSHRSTSYAVTN